MYFNEIVMSISKYLNSRVRLQFDNKKSEL